jgi:light-regulated signal transduction histidine kinase (bacteriophytochrome)
MSNQVDGSLYSDFTLTRTNCHQEPIHRPLAIQGSGHLLAFDPGLSRLLAVSEGVPELLGISESMLWGSGLEVLPRKLVDAVGSEVARGAAATQAGKPLRWVADQAEYHVLCHQSDGVWLAELELAGEDGLNAFDCLAFEDRLGSARSVEDLYGLMAKEFRRLFGYDRVMVYRLDADGHGEVVGEDAVADLEPLIGLRYPATDIPPPARKLLVEHGSRSIPGLNLPNSWILFSPEWPARRHLDLARSQLRATSPIHVEYLANMGVEASLTIPIIVHDKLWGLVACHHRSPRDPAYPDRRIGSLLAGSAVRVMLKLEETTRAAQRAAAAKARQAFIDAVTVEDGYGLLLLLDPSILLALCRCDGAAVIARSRPGATAGLVPGSGELQALSQMLAGYSAENGPLLATDSLAAEYPDLAGSDSEIGGLLAVRVSNHAENYVVWFRRKQRHTVTWAGNPNGPQTEEWLDDDGNRRLSPRSSFAAWGEVIEDRCLAWEPQAISAAAELRQDVLSLELERTADIVRRRTEEFEVLMSEASHDLEHPLRTQRGYLDLIRDELSEGASPEQVADFVDRASEAVSRMQDLVQDLLAYGRLSGDVTWEPVDLNEVMASVLEDLADQIAHSSAQLEVGELPTLRADLHRCRRLLGNLVSNALKYVDAGESPQVRVWCHRSDEALIINVEDRGIGIEPEQQQEIFEIFTRLHRRDQYPGTGIGLAIAKRAAEDLQGAIGVDSVPGEGSTFWCRFHRGREVRT